MSFPKYKDLADIKTVIEIDQETFILQKSLFDLKMKESTKKDVKPHIFTHTKRRIAQLKFKKSLLLNLKTKEN